MPGLREPDSAVADRLIEQIMGLGFRGLGFRVASGDQCGLALPAGRDQLGLAGNWPLLTRDVDTAVQLGRERTPQMKFGHTGWIVVQ